MDESILSVPYLGSLVVLGLAGGLKLRDPRLAAAAARRVGVDRHAESAVRALAVTEIAVALAGWTGVLAPVFAALAALVYLAFTALTFTLLRSSEPVSCGCFGVRSVTVNGVHVALNAASALACAGAAVTGARLEAAAGPGWAVAIAVQALVVAGLLASAYTMLEPAPYAAATGGGAPAGFVIHHVRQEQQR